MKIFWATILIFIGLLFLGANLGWWNNIAWENIWQYWPLILIWWGLALIFRKWSWGWLIVLIAFLIGFLMILDSLIFPNPILKFNNWQQNYRTKFFSEDLQPNITSTKIKLSTMPGKITIDKTSDKLIEGELSSALDPELKVTYDNDQAIVNFGTSKQGFSNWGKSELTIRITDKIPVELEINSGASDLKLNLEDIILKSMIVKSGASSIDTRIGEKIENGLTISLETGASSVKIKYPQKVGIKIKTQSGLSSNNFKDFKKVDDNIYQTENYDSTLVKTDLNIKAGASSISITQE